MIVWTEYMKYRVKMRGFDFAEIERLLKFGDERYIDTATGRSIVVGRHSGELVAIPYEEGAGDMTPITIHVTSRQQIRFRSRTGRYRHE